MENNNKFEKNSKIDNYLFMENSLHNLSDELDVDGNSKENQEHQNSNIVIENDLSSLVIYNQIDECDFETCLYIFYEALKNDKMHLCEYVWNKIHHNDSSFDIFIALFETKTMNVDSKWIAYVIEKHYVHLSIKEKIKLFKKCISCETCHQPKYILIFQKIIDDEQLHEMLDLPLHSFIICLDSICLEYYNLICHDITWTQLWNMPSFSIEHVYYFARQNILLKNASNEFQLWFERFLTQKKFPLHLFESLLIEEILENSGFENQKSDYYFYILQNLDLFTECTEICKLCCIYYKLDVTKKYLLEQNFLNFASKHIIHMCYVMFRELKEHIFLFEITMNQKSALDYLLECIHLIDSEKDTLFYQLHYIIDNFRDPNHIYNNSKNNTLEFLITNSINEFCDLFDITIYFIINYEWKISFFACNDDIPMFFPKVIADTIFKQFPELLHSDKYFHYKKTYSYLTNTNVSFDKLLRMCKVLYIPPELANYMIIPNDKYISIALQYNL